MKLDAWEMRAAFAADDLDAAIRGIERHFRVSFPDSAFAKEHRNVHRNRSHEYEINITCMSQHYSWSAWKGFTLTCAGKLPPDLVHVRVFTDKMLAPAHEAGIL